MLDQVAFGIPKEKCNQELIQKEIVDIEEERDICLWEKEEDLDQYMEEKYNQERNEDVYEQGKNVEIDLDDIERIKALIADKKFQVQDMSNMLACLDEIASILNDGKYRVFYSASW